MKTAEEARAIKTELPRTTLEDLRKANGILTDAEIYRRFSYHRPEGKKVDDHEDVRRRFRRWAHELRDILPPGRENSLAFTALEEASFWAHAAIAREGK